eukprot:649016-Pelagomonas_calceolata.AAC.1
MHYTLQKHDSCIGAPLSKQAALILRVEQDPEAAKVAVANAGLKWHTYKRRRSRSAVGPVPWKKIRMHELRVRSTHASPAWTLFMACLVRPILPFNEVDPLPGEMDFGYCVLGWVQLKMGLLQPLGLVNQCRLHLVGGLCAAAGAGQDEGAAQDGGTATSDADGEGSAAAATPSRGRGRGRGRSRGSRAVRRGRIKAEGPGTCLDEVDMEDTPGLINKEQPVTGGCGARDASHVRCKIQLVTDVALLRCEVQPITGGRGARDVTH